LIAVPRNGNSLLVSCLAYNSTLEIGAISSSEKSVGLHQTTRRYTPGGHTTPSLSPLRLPQIQRTVCFTDIQTSHQQSVVQLDVMGADISEHWPGSDAVLASYCTTAVTLLAIVVAMCSKLYGPSCDCQLRHLSLLVARLFTHHVQHACIYSCGGPGALKKWEPPPLTINFGYGNFFISYKN
jgi:hypothetical protein